MKSFNGQNDGPVNAENFRAYRNSVRRRVSADLTRNSDTSMSFSSVKKAGPVVSRYGSCEKIRPSSVLLNEIKKQLTGEPFPSARYISPQKTRVLGRNSPLKYSKAKALEFYSQCQPKYESSRPDLQQFSIPKSARSPTVNHSTIPTEESRDVSPPPDTSTILELPAFTVPNFGNPSPKIADSSILSQVQILDEAADSIQSVLPLVQLMKADRTLDFKGFSGCNPSYRAALERFAKAVLNKL